MTQKYYKAGLNRLLRRTSSSQCSMSEKKMKGDGCLNRLLRRTSSSLYDEPGRIGMLYEGVLIACCGGLLPHYHRLDGIVVHIRVLIACCGGLLPHSMHKTFLCALPIRS